MKAFVTILGMLPVMAFAQPTFEVKGTVTGLPDKSVVALTDMNNPGDTLSKGLAANGKFTLTGKVAQPNLYHLNFSNANKKALVFLDNSKMSITGNVNDIQQLVITGSPSHKDFQDFQSTFNPLFKTYTELNQQAGQSGMTDSVAAAVSQANTAIQAKVDAFITEKKNSYVSPFVLLVTSQLSADLALLEGRYNKLSPNVQQSTFGLYLKQMIDDGKVGAVGSQALEFTQNNAEGKPVALSSFRGKYVLVDFWASWCRPCRMENPNVVRVFNQFKDKNFTVLGVSLDKTKEAWLKAIEEDQLAWTHVSDLKFWQNEVAAMYKVQSIPTNLLVDPSGKIVGKNLRGEALQARLCELLGCN